MTIVLADAGFPAPILAGGLACVVLGVLLSAVVIILGLAWVLNRKTSSTAAAIPPRRAPMRVVFASFLILGGVICLATATVSGTNLDSAYVKWSAAKYAVETSRPSNGLTDSRPRYESSLAGAPLSILSPTLIWLSVGVGLILIAIGLWTGLRSPRTAMTQDNRAAQDREP